MERTVLRSSSGMQKSLRTVTSAARTCHDGEESLGESFVVFHRIDARFCERGVFPPPPTLALARDRLEIRAIDRLRPQRVTLSCLYPDREPGA
jgi:hypothetical protein